MDRPSREDDTLHGLEALMSIMDGISTLSVGLQVDNGGRYRIRRKNRYMDK